MQCRERRVGSDVAARLLAEQPAHLEQIAVRLDGRAGVVQRGVREVFCRCHHFDHPQPRRRRLVDVLAGLPNQLRLVGLQVAEQNTGLPLADVQTGQLPQPLGVKAPIANGDMDSELARILGDRLQRDLVDGEAHSFKRRMVPSTR